MTDTLAAVRLPALGEDWPVLTLNGREAFSEVDWLDVWVHPEAEVDPWWLLEQSVGEGARVRIGRAEAGARYFHGEVVEARTVPAMASKLAVVLRVESLLGRLRRRTTSRVFQEQSATDIVTRLLEEHDVPHEWRLRGRLPARTSYVQYRETDLATLQHLLGEEGVFFWSEHDEPQATLVLADHASGYTRGAEALRYRPDAEATALTKAMSDSLFDLGVSRRVRTKAVIARRYDLRRPYAGLDGLARVEDGEDVVNEGVQVREFRQRVPLVAAETQYLHGRSVADRDGRPEDAPMLLEQLRRDAWTAEGRSDALLSLGRLVPVVDHPVDVLNAPLAMVELEHVVEADGGEQTYRNGFRAVREEAAYRPAVPAARRIDAVELATVMGDESGTVHTDELGRVRVRFHWERLQGDEPPACWVRVAQAWAGTGLSLIHI